MFDIMLLDVKKIKKNRNIITIIIYRNIFHSFYNESKHTFFLLNEDKMQPENHANFTYIPFY